MDSSSQTISNPYTKKPILKKPLQAPTLTLETADGRMHSHDGFSTSPTGWMDNGVMAMVRQRRVSFSAELLNDEGRHVPHTEAEAERQRGKRRGSAAQTIPPPQGLFFSESNDLFDALEDYQSGCESDDEDDEDSLSGNLNGSSLFRVGSIDTPQTTTLATTITEITMTSTVDTVAAAPQDTPEQTPTVATDRPRAKKRALPPRTAWQLFLYGNGAHSDDEEDEENTAPDALLSPNTPGAIAQKPDNSGSSVNPQIGTKHPTPLQLVDYQELISLGEFVSGSSLSTLTDLPDVSEKAIDTVLSAQNDNSLASSSSSTPTAVSPSQPASPTKSFFNMWSFTTPKAPKVEAPEPVVVSEPVQQPEVVQPAPVYTISPDVPLAVPERNQPELFKSTAPASEKRFTWGNVTTAVYNTALSPARVTAALSPTRLVTALSPLKITNAEINKDDDTTLLAASPADALGPTPFADVVHPKELSPITLGIASAPHEKEAHPEGSVMHRRLQEYDMIMKSAKENADKLDFNSQQPTSGSVEVVSWAAFQALSAASETLNLFSDITEKAANVTGHPQILVNARDSVLCRAKGVVGWVTGGKTAQSLINKARRQIPDVFDHALSNAIGIEPAASGVPPAAPKKSSFLSSMMPLERVRTFLGPGPAGVAVEDSKPVKFVGAHLRTFDNFYMSTSPVIGTTPEDGQEIPRLVATNAPSFSFSSVGGPADALYLVGTAKSLLQQFKPQLFSQRDGFKWLGCGYGSVVAAAMALQLGYEGLEQVRRMFERIEKLNSESLFCGMGKMSSLLSAELDALIPEDISCATWDNLFISVTLAPQMSNEVISVFSSKQKLIDAILASCYVPLVHEAPKKIHNPSTGNCGFGIAGALTNRLPLFDAMTVTVSPVPGEGNISPWSKTLSQSQFDAGFAVSGKDPSDLASAIKDDLYASTGYAAPAGPFKAGFVDCHNWVKTLAESGRMAQTAFSWF
ncbi:1-acylglycerol-3-phosphate O-acyltransferase pnpla3 [Chytriomyces hyalinus]|nr:1-acylglycerol-3-phosphate O-acyltransferase pnpla3 [Chytriomyces hyalinus]